MKKLVLKILNNFIRKSSLITRIIFGVKIKRNDRIQWDFTTLILKNCLLERIKSNQKVLEIGTGPYGVLSVLLSKRVKCEITACDVNKDYVMSAGRTFNQNEVTANILYSDLFENINGSYDVIFFNAVYIPRQMGEELGIDGLHKNLTDWCGGETGMETIDKFLNEAPGYLKENGELLLGFNPRYLSAKTLIEQCQKFNYIIRDIFRSHFNPCLVLVIYRE